MSFYATPINSSAVPSHSLDKLDMKNFLQAKFHDCFYTITFYFIWFNYSVGIVDISVQSAGIGKYATPTRHLNFQFTLLAVSYELFPWWNQRQSTINKDNQISSWSNPIVYSSCLWKNSSWVTSGKQAAKQPLCGLFRGSCHMLHYMIRVTPLCVLWKLLKAHGRTTSSVTDVCLTSRFSRKNKDKTWVLM